MLTMQEVFTKAKDHLLKQGKKAAEPNPSGEDDRCFYRMENGLKCPVGALIEDEFYSPSLEGKGVYNIYIRRALRKSGVPVSIEIDNGYPYEEILVLLQGLQALHDEKRYDPKDWPEGLRKLAYTFGLTY